MIAENKIKFYIPALTSLRAIAAFMVFLHHFNFLPTFNNVFLSLLYFQGYVGVSLFFILSGFLIHRNYNQNFCTREPAVFFGFLKTYFRNRFARVYPMYFLILVATLLTYRVTGLYQWGLHLTLFKGFSNIHKFAGVATAWSLTVEECYYFLFPVIALLRFRKTPYLLLLVAIYILGWLLNETGEYHRIEGFFYPDQFVMIYTFFGRAFEFFLGMLVSELILNGRLKKFARPVYTLSGIGLSLFTIIGLTVIAYSARTSPADLQVVAMFSPAGLVVHNFILPLGFALLILGLALEKSKLHNLLSLPIFQVFGKSSYIFYLLQAGVFQMYLVKYLNRPGNITIFIMMLITSVTLFLLVEDPLNRLIRGQKNPIFELNKFFSFRKQTP